MFFLTRPGIFISQFSSNTDQYHKHTADLEGIEAGLVGNESVELLLSQFDDLGHLNEDLLCVGVAWLDALFYY